MATDRDWAKGYLEQGREDLAAAIQVGASAPSTVAMLLQMVFEKFAKAAMLKLGAPRASVEKSHHVASRLIHVLKTNPPLLATLVSSGSISLAVWAAVSPLVQELEDAHPAPPRDPKTRKSLPRPVPEMLEFPWEDPTTADIRWPAQDLPMARRFGSPTNTDLPQLLTFAQALSTHHSTLFP